MAPTSIKFLTGAPLSGSLIWTASKELVSELEPRVHRYLKGAQRNLDSMSIHGEPRWRTVPLATSTFHLSSQPGQGHAVPPFSPLSLSANRQCEVIPGGPSEHDDQFLEHSFAIHNQDHALEMTSVSQPSILNEPSTTFITEGDMTSLLFEDSTLLVSPDQLAGHGASAEARFLNHGPITDLKAIPDAVSLHKLQPQTVTVNLIVALIGPATSRTVMVRRGNYPMEIMEILVGDDTKTGFTITSWHTPLQSQQDDTDNLRATLRSLKPMDVVLVECVALSSFKGNVFGQCLTRRFSRSATRITPFGQELLPNNVKLRKVKDWVARFIAPLDRKASKAAPPDHVGVASTEFLPPDTPL